MAALTRMGADEHAREGVKHPGRHGDAQGVVDERQEQVLPDRPDRQPAQPPRSGHAAQVAAYQRHRGALQGHVGAAAQGDADVGLRQRRGVVDVQGFSGHADHDDFLHLLGPLAGKTRRVRLVHGYRESSEALSMALRNSGFGEVEIPWRGDKVSVA